MPAVKNTLRLMHRLFQSVLFDPLDILRKLMGLPLYFRDVAVYLKAGYPRGFPITAADAFPVLAERFTEAGVARGHYFFQDIWAARKVRALGAPRHVDVGSRLDGFVAHLLPFTDVVYVDIRPLDIELEGLEFTRGSLLELPFADVSLSSLSCLHVLEHVGLGRYGDPVNPEGYIAAARELSRVLSPGGRLLLGVPVGRERLCFNAHRVFDPETILSLFPGMKVKEFSLVDDEGRGIIRAASFATARECSYGCGLFEFEK